jgi:DNA-binding transcriptional LysR family regulator
VDLAQIRSFATVARWRSFTRAASELGLSQPAVSRHVQKLEHELGFPLLVRRRGRIQLSEAGVRFLAFAEEVMGSHTRLLRELSPEPGRLAGDLRIAASTTPGEFIVPGLVAEFGAAHPMVKPEIRVMDSAEVAAELRARRADIGFSGLEAPGGDLSHHVVAEDEVVVAVPAGHPFASRHTIELSELAGQPFLARESGSGTYQSFEEAVSAHPELALPAYRVVMVLSTTQAIVSAVRNGYGIGLVSCLALQDRGSEGPVPVRIAGLPLTRFLYLVAEKDRPLSSAASAFADWVQVQPVTVCG